MQVMLERAAGAALPTEEIMRVCLTKAGKDHLDTISKKAGGRGGGGGAIREEE